MKDTDEILIALRRITRAIDLHSKQLVKTSGLTAPQLVVLHALVEHGPLAPSTLAKRVAVSPATITSIVERLEKMELVERHKREADRRGVEIRLTEKGSARYEGAPELLQAEFLSRFRQLEQWERLMLLAALERVAHLMDAENLDASPILTPGEYDRSPDS